jgi:hypothetical protein
MSWDILIMDLPRDVQAMSDLPDDFRPRPLGGRGDLIKAIISAAPMADFADPSWGRIATRDFSIEVNMAQDEQVDSIMLHVRGGDAAIGLIAAILDQLHARALDIQTGQVFEETTAAASLDAWRAYRDRVISPGRSQPPT